MPKSDFLPSLTNPEMFPQTQATLCSICSSKKDVNPGRFRFVDRCGYYSEGILSFFVVIQIFCTVVLFAVGLLVWSLRFIFQGGCNAAFSALFASFGSLIDAACLSLASAGLPQNVICGQDLIDVCTLFQGLRIEYVSYGAALFILAQLMFLSSIVNTMFVLGVEWEHQRRQRKLDAVPR